MLHYLLLATRNLQVAISSITGKTAQRSLFWNNPGSQRIPEQHPIPSQVPVCPGNLFSITKVGWGDRSEVVKMLFYPTLLPLRNRSCWQMEQLPLVLNSGQCLWVQLDAPQSKFHFYRTGLALWSRNAGSEGSPRGTAPRGTRFIFVR